MFLFTALRRAFASNLSVIAATPHERTTLESLGILEPALQRYFVWRRSLVAAVVLLTLLNAALTAYHAQSEPSGPDLFQALSDRLLKDAQEALPRVPGIEDLAAPLIDSESGDSNDEPDEDDMPADTADPAGGGNPRAVADKAAASIAESREGDEEDAEDEPATALGRFTDAVEQASAYALPLAAIAVLFCWTKLLLSFRILLAGFVVSFFVPMLISFCPWSWWEGAAAGGEPESPLARFTGTIEELRDSIEYLCMLLPTVLSLIPGVQRAGLRVKTLLPESMLPGWFLVASAPFYALFLFVIFVAINQAAGDLLFLAGFFLFLAAPLMYVVRANVFTSPLTSSEDYRRLRRVQKLVGALTVLAGTMLVAYLVTQQVLGVHLVGTDPRTSVLRPLHLVGFFLELFGRSLFMTLLGADLFMRMDLAAWKNSKAFIASPAAAGHDRVMTALDQAAR